jgi:predicted XRE-type DNA-binding protein
MDVEKGSINVYADLGYPDADDMLVKAQLITKIHEIIKTHGWTQQEAADVLGMTQLKLSGVLRGQFREISVAKLMTCLIRMGRRVQIVIGPACQTSDVSHVEVVFSA